MNTEEAINLVKEKCSRTGSSTETAIGLAIAGSLIADAINRLAAAQERQADIAEKQWELSSGMMATVSPMMKNMGDLTQRMKDDLEEGESWRKGPGGLQEGDDNDESLLDLDG